MSRDRPLEGRRVVVTRGVDKSDRLPAFLEAAGAIVVKVPLIRPVELASGAGIRAAVAHLQDGGESGARWLVLTSETAVALVMAAVGAADLAGVAIAVVGPATASALRGHGVDATVVAPGQEADSLAAELARVGVDGASVLVIAAAGGRQVVAPALAAGGARVEVLEAYRSVMPEGAAERLRAVFTGAPVDAITFTSGSTVRHCAVALPVPPARCTAVCIGPVTARAAREAGWESIVTANDHTAAGMVAALVGRLTGAHPLP
jgi:uroporphyrinogen-III synthase